MAIVYEKSRGLTDVEFHYCPGCHHGIIHKLVAESLVELGLLDDAIGVCPVGCSVFAYKYFNCDMQEAAHGRAPAVATGIKRTHPHQAVFITAYGTPARIALTALETLRAEGLKVGLFRPITLWPFPEEALRKLSKADHVKAFLDVEMSSTGQMIDDVRLSVEGRKPIHYLGHAGGVMPTVEEMVEAAKKALKEGK